MMYGGWLGVGYWFENSDCETVMGMDVMGETQAIPLNMSKNLERIMCVTDNRELMVVSVLSIPMMLIGLYTTVKGVRRMLGDTS